MTTLQARPTARLEDLRATIAAYNQVTERLKDSHDRLMGEVARLRSELAAKNQQLERRKRLAGLGEMAAGVAHEIRNPLGSIQLYADLLGRQLSAGSKPADLAARIAAAVRGLDAIVSDMLTFTRVIQADRCPTLFAALVAEAAAAVAPQLASAAVTLRADSIDPALRIDLDGRLFQRVLVNLMLNAADAMGGQPRPPVLIVQAESLAETPGRSNGPADGARWRIRVRDNGPGIAPAVLDKMFHPFFTTKSSGTGLGLAIVHHIVEAHGGSIAAANDPDGGACFTILLP